MTERPRFPIGVNVFCIREGALLLGQRKNCAGAGEWGLPGGHLEHGERMVDAAARELAEETSLRAESYSFANVVNDPRNTDHYIQVGFVAAGIMGEVVLCEPERCAAWQWFSLDDLPEKVFFGHAEQIALFVAGRQHNESL